MTMDLTVCVFAGANRGRTDAHFQRAYELGSRLARAGVGLVYGGAGIGLMAAVADGALAEGGDVVGVIPEFLVAKEVASRNLTDLRVVPSMHERKALMARLSDAYVVLPGGLGTLDECFEALTWSLLGLHRKPVVLLNLDGYFDNLLRFLDQAVVEGFIQGDRATWLSDVATVEAAVSLVTGIASELAVPGDGTE
jgi:uncharacterized protein (TIGR00730 family)